MRQIFRSVVCVALMAMVFTGCSTSKKAVRSESAALPKINYDEVQNRLGLDIAPGLTGFREKKFDACDLGAALLDLSPPLKDCHNAYFSLVHFQLSCRGADSSQVFTQNDLTAVANQRIVYNVGATKGVTKTDYRGAGVARAITSKSQKHAYLRLSTGVDFLMMRAGEVTEIVTPPSWCGK